MSKHGRRRQSGIFLIEAMVAILIFALGILGLVAMGGTAVSAQSDAQYRTEASAMTDAIAGMIALNINRDGPDELTKEANKAASLILLNHQATGSATAAGCAFSGAPTANPDLLLLLNRAANVTGQGLPGASATTQQVIVDPAGNFNRVEITVCWKTASDSGWRHHTLVTYVN